MGALLNEDYEENSPMITEDEEFIKSSKERDKKEFLKELSNTSKKSFSVKNIKSQNEKTPRKNRYSIKTENGDIDNVSLHDLIHSRTESYEMLNEEIINDDIWDRLVNQFEDGSAIDDIAGEDKYLYRRQRKGEDKYSEMFVKETSMLNDILKNLNTQSKQVRDKLSAVLGKKSSSAGVSKYVADLLDSSTVITSTQLQAIKQLTDIKKSIADFRYKDAKNIAENGGGDSNDAVANAFYQSIINGGRQNFMNSATSGISMNNITYENPDEPNISINHNDDDEDDEYETGFNITQPFQHDTSSNDDYNIPNTIKYEKSGARIALYRYSDDTLEFVALASDGTEIEGYDLPNSDLLNSMKITPGTKYAYDTYGRKYEIIDISDDGFVSLEDI